MKIGPVGNTGRPTGPEDEKQRKNQAVTDSERQGSEARKDSIEISESGRQKAEQVQSSESITRARSTEETRENSEEVKESNTEKTEVRQDKVEQAKERIESGYYNRPEVKKEIARRITDDFAG
jgi:anti-sigma28 factor (negative regulator of flagellin synthesis)